MANTNTVSRSTKLGPEEREAALEKLKSKELDILVVGGGIVGDLAGQVDRVPHAHGLGERQVQRRIRRRRIALDLGRRRS